MAETLYRCVMANTMGTSDKVWGAVVLKHTTPLVTGGVLKSYQYGSAWGRHGWHISKKLQKPEWSMEAIQRYGKATREKVSEDYHLVAPGYDFNLKTTLDNILLDQTMVAKAIDQAISVATPKEKIAKPAPKPVIPLPDLPCTALVCGHYLDSHATKTQTPEVGGRICLVLTCSCEQYRRTCFECGYTSVNWWVHARDCLTGQKEKPTPREDKPTTTTSPIYVRQPRRIMHLISDD